MKNKIYFTVAVLVIVIVGGGVYRKQRQLESVEKMCLSNFGDKIFCGCVVDRLSEVIPFYKATDAYAWFSDTKSESDEAAKKVAADCKNISTK